MLRATPGEPIPLQVLLPDGQEDLTVRATILAASGPWASAPAPQVLTLPHQTMGLYSSTWVPSLEGFYSVVYDVFYDPECTLPANYDRDGEQVDVNSDKIHLMRLLGLQHENSVVDQQVFSASGRLLTARIRAYDTAANAAAALNAGIKFVWQLQATYNAKDQLDSYKILRQDAWALGGA